MLGVPADPGRSAAPFRSRAGRSKISSIFNRRLIHGPGASIS
jgi:hypothetical protein